jgi:hypothetical protein
VITYLVGTESQLTKADKKGRMTTVCSHKQEILDLENQGIYFKHGWIQGFTHYQQAFKLKPALILLISVCLLTSSVMCLSSDGSILRQAFFM